MNSNKIKQITANRKKLEKWKTPERITNELLKVLKNGGFFYKNVQHKIVYFDKSSSLLHPFEDIEKVLNRLGWILPSSSMSYTLKILDSVLDIDSLPSIIEKTVSYSNTDRDIVYVFDLVDQVYKITSDKIDIIPNDGQSGVYFTKLPNTSKLTYIPNTTIKLEDTSFYQYINADPLYKTTLLLMLQGIYLGDYLKTLPIIICTGSSGDAKSSAASLMGIQLFGDNDYRPSTISKDENTFYLDTRRSPFVSFDNVETDHKPRWLEDALCVVCTGGKTSQRKLYTTADMEDYIINCSVLVTSISVPFARPDVLNRAIVVPMKKLVNKIPELAIKNAIITERNDLFSYTINNIQKYLGNLSLFDNYSNSKRLVGFLKMCAITDERHHDLLDDHLSQDQSALTYKDSELIKSIQTYLEFDNIIQDVSLPEMYKMLISEQPDFVGICRNRQAFMAMFKKELDKIKSYFILTTITTRRGFAYEIRLSTSENNMFQDMITDEHDVELHRLN